MRANYSSEEAKMEGNGEMVYNLKTTQKQYKKVLYNSMLKL